MKTRYGTSHFASYGYAEIYYRGYVPNYNSDQLHSYVAGKVKAGEINIGKPTIKAGQRLLVNSEGRYVIEE